jgi:hypothetical protein
VDWGFTENCIAKNKTEKVKLKVIRYRGSHLGVSEKIDRGKKVVVEMCVAKISLGGKNDKTKWRAGVNDRRVG